MTQLLFVSGFEKTAISKTTIHRAIAKAEERAYNAAKELSNPNKSGPEKEALRQYMLKKHRNQEGLEAGLVRRFIRSNSSQATKTPSTPRSPAQTTHAARPQAPAGHA